MLSHKTLQASLQTIKTRWYNHGLYVLIDISLTQSSTGGISSSFLIFALLRELLCFKRHLAATPHSPHVFCNPSDYQSIRSPWKTERGDLWQRRLPWQQAQLSQLPIAEVKHNQLNHITGSWQGVDRMEHLPVVAQRDNWGEDRVKNHVVSDLF